MSTTTTPTTTPPATVPASQVIPFPLPWGQIPCPPIPGCAPGCGPAGMDALMKCYMDIKNAMAFISKVMIDLINNDPAVAQAMIAAIEKSGSSLPLIGVTDGVAAQPGQVGEYVQFQQTISYNNPMQTENVSVGVLTPGDWDVWADMGGFTAGTNSAMGWLYSAPTALSNDASFGISAALPSGAQFVSPARQLLNSQPCLLTATLNVESPTAGLGGTFTLFVNARRRR